MTRHEYTKDEITPVLAFRKEGYTYTKISNITKIPISTVRWLVKKHAKDNCAKLKAPNRRGKDKGLSRRDVSALTRNLLRDRRQSLDQLAQYGNGVQPLAKSTVLRVLERIGCMYVCMYEICFYSCLLSYYMLINVDYTITYFLPIPSTVPRTRARSELLNVSLVPPRVEFYTALPVSIVGRY